MTVYDVAVAAERQSKGDRVYEWLRAAIFDGTYGPTDRLNADAISRERGVSKIPVREALQRLTSEGLVVQQHFAGAVVAPLSWRELAGIRIARGAIEPMAARVGARRRTEVDLQRLRDNVAAMRALLDTGELDGFFDLNRQFHTGFVQCAGYPVLDELASQVLHKVSRYRAVLPVTLDTAKSILADHEEILATFEAGKSREAEQLVRKHVTGEQTITADAWRIDARLFEDTPDALD